MSDFRFATEEELSLREQVDALKQQRDGLEQQVSDYRDTIAQQAELLAAHKAEMQDWQRELLKARQERDELLAKAQAVVDRWNTPLWKNEKPTAEHINALTLAIKRVKP